MRTAWPRSDGIVVRGRAFAQGDLVLIRRLIRNHPTWGRTKLSEAVCEAISWRQENGRLKDRGCRVALLKLEALGYLQLPPKKLDRGGRPPRQEVCDLHFADEVSAMPRILRLEFVKDARESRIWNSLIAKHHYLGLATPVGRLIRYIILGDGKTLGAISFSEAAWSLKGRDSLLGDFGLSLDDIRASVISNNRFLILPHVKVRNLASRILASATKQVVADWNVRFQTVPLFIETFVDPSRFEGTCYRAANWTLVGNTKGFSKQGANHSDKKTPKLHFMIGTSYNTQHFLQERFLRGDRRAA